MMSSLNEESAEGLLEEHSEYLSLVDDGISYSKEEIIQLLAMIEAGNNGRLKKISSFFGIIGIEEMRGKFIYR